MRRIDQKDFKDSMYFLQILNKNKRNKQKKCRKYSVNRKAKNKSEQIIFVIYQSIYLY